MKRLLIACTLAAGAVLLSAADGFRQTYPLDPAKVKQNEARVQADLKSVPAWADAPYLYYTVDPMSSIKRLPDTFPTDGRLCGDLGIIAAQNEYEPASFVIYPRKNADKFTFAVSDLKSADGTVFSAGNLDLKLLKVWYQTGSSWYGYFADALCHALCPELLVNDEDLVRVVCTGLGDNFVKYHNEDGSVSHQWMTAPYTALDYNEYLGQANTNLIRDAETLQPVVLNKNEFKQFFLTAYVPKGQKPGLYTGTIRMNADGKDVGLIPVKLRVLPFELPEARTYHDPNREYFLALYGTATSNPKVLKNQARHNALHSHGFPFADPFYPQKFRKDVKTAKECGLNLSKIMCGIASCAGGNPEKLNKLYNASMELVRKEVGDVEVFSYGIDEGNFWAIRKQRPAWDEIHKAGAKVMVSSMPHDRIQYGLDYVAFAFAPVGKDIRHVEAYHRMNPKSYVGWYANPHSAPENPDLFRRMHGYVAYRGNFDASSNYCWWRNNWNDFSVIDEHTMRGLIMVYATQDDIIDTIEWEGVREGVDDIRYLTVLKRLADEANNSKDWDVQRLGRNALSFIAYSDPERDTIDPIRMECISYILKLQEALKKGGK